MPGRWVNAGDLRKGDVVYLRTEGLREIEKIIIIDGGQWVYNFHVEELECYAVGSGQVLVHNTSATVCFKRWKRGDAIDKPLSNGQAPDWKTVQGRYWKNRYQAVRAGGNQERFSQENLDRMRRGVAPMDYNPRTGKWESRELHHVDAQRWGGDNSPDNLRELTPDWHAEVDPSRHVPGVEPTRGIR